MKIRNVLYHQSSEKEIDMTVISICSTEISIEQPDVLSAAIPLHLHIINTLPQVRKTMNANGDMDDLVESILSKGQKVAGLALALKPRAARQYLKEVNRLWGTKHSLRSLKKVHFSDKGGEHYLILVYGHRRLRACALAQKRLQSGETSTSFVGTYRCDIHFGMSFQDAFSIQLLENLYLAPPKHEELAAMWRYWRYLRASDPFLSVSTFARTIGRRPEVVRDMLRFSNLPEAVQDKIRPDAPGGKASFALLKEVARKAEAFEAFDKPMGELELIRLVDLLVAKRVRASDYARQVSEEIRHLQNEQQDLFAEMLSEPVETRTIRKVAAAELIQSILRNIHYLATINAMMKTDAFGGLSPYAEGTQKEISAQFSPDSPARTALKLMEVLKGAVPDLAEMLRRDEKSDTKLQSALVDLEISEAVFSAVLKTS